MPVDLLVLGAALLTGLLGTVHCGAMCGGIAVGLGSAGPVGRAGYRAIASNLGRVLGYALAGAAVGGLGGGLLDAMALEGLAGTLRIGIGLVLLWAALRIVRPRWAAALPAPPLWHWLAPLRRRVPADGPLRPWVMGLLWGWLPCGFSAIVLTAAWLEADALHGALLMAAFGLGTLPVMAMLGWSGARWGRRTPAWRHAGAAVIAASGVLTLAAPMLVSLPAMHAALAALGCRSVVG
jgi:hypothetical protein